MSTSSIRGTLAEIGHKGAFSGVQQKYMNENIKEEYYCEYTRNH